MTLKPCPNPDCRDPHPKVEHGEYIMCSNKDCEVEGPADDLHGEKWNALPRLDDIGWWRNCDDELPVHHGFFKVQLQSGQVCDLWFAKNHTWQSRHEILRWFKPADPPAPPPLIKPEPEPDPMTVKLLDIEANLRSLLAQIEAIKQDHTT